MLSVLTCVEVTVSAQNCKRNKDDGSKLDSGAIVGIYVSCSPRQSLLFALTVCGFLFGLVDIIIDLGICAAHPQLYLVEFESLLNLPQLAFVRSYERSNDRSRLFEGMEHWWRSRLVCYTKPVAENLSSWTESFQSRAAHNSAFKYFQHQQP
jgi:hypothetical protein